jgi:hypothetical protein
MEFDVQIGRRLCSFGDVVRDKVSKSVGQAHFINNQDVFIGWHLRSADGGEKDCQKGKE